MSTFFVNRLLLAILTVIAASILSFVIIVLPPGDWLSSWIKLMEDQGTTVGVQEAQQLRELYALDQPISVQYLRWIGRVLQGDLGYSILMNKPVNELIGERLGLTILISLTSILFTWIVALPIGVYSAVKQYSIGDYISTIIGFLGISIPSFLLALLTMYLGWKWFGADLGGLFSKEYIIESWSLAKAWNMIKHLPVPTIVLALGGTAGMMRIMRANLLDELNKPYVITARAKGLPEHVVIAKYPMRVALNPFVSNIGYLLPQIISGSIIVSMVLGLQTVGPLLLDSLMSQDMYLAGAIIMMLSVATVIGTFLSDLLLMAVDPRIRMEGVS